MADTRDAGELYDEVVAFFGCDPAVEQARMFGASGLSIGRKTFAMLHRGELVVKLDPARCKGLVEGGLAKFFDPGHGRVMKAWVGVAPAHAKLWTSLAAEARAYVGALKG